MAAFDRYLRTILERAGHHAREEGATTIEAQHLLLAMASDSVLGHVLEELGLDQRAIRAALALELEHATRAAGMSFEAFEQKRPKAVQGPAAHPGTSVQHALERGLGGVRTAPRPAHVLLGILSAELGTVPRALALARIDRADLIARVRQVLAADEPGRTGND